MSHPVKRALQRDLLPYLVSARRLRRQWFCVAHLTYGVTTDLVVAFAAIGVTAPLLAMIGFAAAGDGVKSQPGSLSAVVASVPRSLSVPTIVILVAWIALRVWFNREDGQRRAVLASSCARTMRQAEASLPSWLSKADPMPDLTQLLEKNVRPTVDRNIQEQSWPWTPFAPEIDVEVEKEVALLCRRYEDAWTPVSPLGLRQVGPGGET
jgi:hypothetical protein